MNKLALRLAILLLGISMTTLHAQHGGDDDDKSTPLPKRSFHTVNVDGQAPTIDGLPDEACWEKVEWSGGYTQWQPSDGEAPTQDTRLKVLYVK